MPIHTLKCTECGRVEDVIRPYRERDRTAPCLATIALTEEDGPIVCTGQLVREGVELNSSMGLQWQLYRRGFAPRQRLG